MRYISILAAIALIFLSSMAYGGQFSSGSTGALGAFNPAADTELQLPADGVFNFTTVTIPSGVKVTFKKNAANTPVYMLATGDVIVAGTISVNGADGASSTAGKGGPGGYDGGYGGGPTSSGGVGLGPGGGATIGAMIGSTHWGSGGGYGTAGGTGGYSGYTTPGGVVYGNERILPVIGGSGGGGAGGGSGTSYPGAGGGGGAGALVIASSGTITVTGSITATGGRGVNINNYCIGGGGSGGAIKLIANTIAGNGTIFATGAPSAYGSAAYGGNGRIRLEAVQITRTTGTTPAYTYGMPGPVFIAKTPSLRISAVGGLDVPSSPTGSYATPDITLPSATTNPVEVRLSASNIPLGTTISVSAIPLSGSAVNVTSSALSGTIDSSTASASVNLSTNYPNIITASATFTIQTAMYYDGEKIEKVRVATKMGKGSEVVYITESGKEIPVEKLMASLMK